MIFVLIQFPGAYALDPESDHCIRCHREQVPIQFCPLVDCDHPIGIDYFAASAGNPSLRPPAALSPFIRLPGGRIGCPTCHVPYFPENHSLLAAQRPQYPAIPDPMLVIDNRLSQLCFSCHIK